MASDLAAIENRLWAAADQLWANTGLKPSEFSTPVLGLIFLRYADKRFTELTQALVDHSDQWACLAGVGRPLVTSEDILKDSGATAKPDGIIDSTEGTDGYVDFEVRAVLFNC